MAPLLICSLSAAYTSCCRLMVRIPSNTALTSTRLKCRPSSPSTWISAPGRAAASRTLISSGFMDIPHCCQRSARAGFATAILSSPLYRLQSADGQKRGRKPLTRKGRHYTIHSSRRPLPAPQPFAPAGHVPGPLYLDRHGYLTLAEGIISRQPGNHHDRLLLYRFGKTHGAT